MTVLRVHFFSKTIIGVIQLFIFTNIIPIHWTEHLRKIVRIQIAITFMVYFFCDRSEKLAELLTILGWRFWCQSRIFPIEILFFQRLVSESVTVSFCRHVFAAFWKRKDVPILLFLFFLCSLKDMPSLPTLIFCVFLIWLSIQFLFWHVFSFFWDHSLD